MVSHQRSRRPHIFYGWVVVGIAFVTMAIAISARTGFSLLFPEIIEEFGWDRGMTAGAFSIGFVASTFMLPIVGVLMERFGVRLTIPFGAVLVAAGYAAMTLVETPLGLYAAMGLLIVNGSMAMSYIVHSIFLANWFVTRRGLAVGIAFSGVGVGGVVLLPLMQTVIDSLGWRTACLGMAVLIIAVVVPLNALFQRDDPLAIGLEPDGAAGRARSKSGAPPLDPVVDKAWAAVDWTVARAVRTGRFWWVFLGFFTGLFVWYAIQAHQTAFLIGRGFDPAFAATALGLVAFFGIGGQIGIGALSDRIGRELAWALALSGYVLCSLLLMIIEERPSAILVYAMVACQGLLGYGLASLYGAIVTEIFAGRRIASIIAMISLGGNLGAGAGVIVLGEIHDLTGNYLLGFRLCLVASLLSILFIFLARPGRIRMVGGKARRRQARLSPRADAAGKDRVRGQP